MGGYIAILSVMKKQLNSYVTRVTDEQRTLLYTILKERGWKFSEVPYAHWKAIGININIVAYNSGKLVIQGKETETFVLFTLEPEILKQANLGYEESEKPSEPFTPHAGMDESGKGDFFGPLVVAAVFVDNESKDKLEELGVKDSKLIKNDKKILAIAGEIRSVVKGKFAIVPIGPESYNRLYGNFKNLNHLLAWGHSRALENLLSKDIECPWALADKFGNERLIKQALFKNGKSIKLKQQTKAESDIAVAAASILARAEFVRRLKLLGEEKGITLPKGASKAVLDTAIEIIRKDGINALNTLAKTHFKTLEKAKIAAEKT